MNKIAPNPYFYIAGILLMTRDTTITFCATLATSLAARMGSITMAAFQVCLQIWLMSSLLADGLAIAGQVRIAINQLNESSFAFKKKNI